VSYSLSIIVPVFNEAGTIRKVAQNLHQSAVATTQIVLVDDGSTDGSCEIIQQITEQITGASITSVKLPSNSGKTMAVRAALNLITSPYVIVQDADLEYDPADIPRLLAVAQERGGAVFGRRRSLWHRPSRWLLAGGVLLVDVCLFVLYRRWVRDHATCYKLMPTQMLRDFDLQSTGFEGCVEITAKLMRSGVAIHQVPISYHPRSAQEGKKLTWRYGFAALQAAWRWRKWVPETSRQAASWINQV
jgi:glycosyltransferase involved in cell wall biosynthesis